MREGGNTMDPASGAELQRKAEYANAAGICMPNRERTWDECGIEEKVERLRRAERENRAWLESVSEQLRHVQPHQHGTHGQVLVEQHNVGYGMVSGTQAGRPFDPLA